MLYLNGCSINSFEDGVPLHVSYWTMVNVRRLAPLFTQQNRKRIGIVLIISCSYWNKRNEEREEMREKKWKEKQK
jgi:hypothetical protein